MLNEVELKKDELVATLHVNREKHVREYEAAYAGWRERVIEALRAKHDAFIDGQTPSLDLNLDKPYSCADSYDEAIAMLEWEQRDVITLDRGTFNQYVLDQWQWKHDFSRLSAGYTASH